MRSTLSILLMMPLLIHAEDVVHLNDGKILRGKILRLATPLVTMEMQLPGGVGSAKRDFDPSLIKFIDFEPFPGEAEALAQTETADGQKRLWEIWQEKSINLKWAQNNSGLLGLTLAQRLLKQSDPFLLERALRIFIQIENDDWDEERQAEAKKGRLRALIALQRVDEAITEARALANDSEDPSLLLEARQVLAMADFERLKAFEKEHPRWMDDDDLTDERTRLYHDVLDQFLHAPLFNGSVDDKAAEALWSVVQLHLFAKEPTLAAQHARDLLELYPNSPFAEKAKPLAAPAPSIKPDDKP
ncbi:MAG: hypothetical protein KDK97_21755 [Verrucomicrobiales bacterium]|nr:hypothetical protein [Verrucomicrobiales bacterium]MCP5559789.1 hypothetical protein [Verrucomicrobiaceae bacterium]